MFAKLKQTGWVAQIVGLVVLGGLVGFGAAAIGGADFSEITTPAKTASKDDLAKLIQGTPEKSKEGVAEIATPKMVSFLDIMSELYGRPDVHFIDARDEPTYESGHIPNAIPLDTEKVEGDKNYGQDRIAALPRTDMLIVYCSGGNCDLSIRLARNLIARGFKKVLVYEGGWTEWVKEGGDKEEGLYVPKGTEG